MASSGSSISRSNTSLTFHGLNTKLDEAITAAAFLVVMMFTFFGSLLILLAIVRNKTSRLRFTTHCYIMSLALGNMVMALSVMPVRVLSFLSKIVWIRQIELCEVYSGMFVFCCSVTVLSLLALSVDRFFSIPRSATYQKMTSRCRVILVILLLWVFAAVLSFLPAELGKKLVAPTWDCKLNRIYSRPFVYCFVTIEVLVPVFLMLVLHCRITKERMNRLRSVDVNGRKIKNLDYSEAPTLSQEASWSQVVIKILLSFILFWIPRCIFLLLDNSQHSSIHEVFDGVTEIMTYCFGASLALLLANYSTDYKNEMTLMLCPYTCYQRRRHRQRYTVNHPNRVEPDITLSTMYRQYSNNSLQAR